MIRGFYERMLDVFRNSRDIAYRYYGEKHSYPEMYAGMKKINSLLRKFRGKKIALYGPKTFSVYCAIYSIILSGNIWIPITPGMPTDRLRSMLGVLMPDIFLFEGLIPDEVRTFLDKAGAEIIQLSGLLSQEKEKEFNDPAFNADDWAYIMFTSGSTGVPKGVPMTHLNYINFINNALEILPFGKGEVFSDYHDFAFDISIFYLFCAPLTESAIAPIQKKEERMMPLVHMQKNGITVWSSVPSVISFLRRYRPDEKLVNSIKIMFLCGEPFSLGILDYCYKSLGIKNVYNFYGLTETGVENFYHACTKDDLSRYGDKGFVPIGRPLKGNDVKVTKDKELLLSGFQITPGYLGGAGQDKFEHIDGVRWYHTGDIVEYDGSVYFCKGRLDSQVKIGGYRVELMDVESHVRQCGGIKEAVCFIHADGVSQRLVCAIEESANTRTDSSDLTKRLKEKLPDYMVPRIFFPLAQMPLNANGKIDRIQVRKAYAEKMAPAKKTIV